MRSRHAACFVNVTGARAHRFLWVKIDVRRADRDVMASIGHELRHTIEVLNAPAVTSRATMFAFYRREGRIETNGAFETVAAVKAGDAVHGDCENSAARGQSGHFRVLVSAFRRTVVKSG